MFSNLDVWLCDRYIPCYMAYSMYVYALQGRPQKRKIEERWEVQSKLMRRTGGFGNAKPWSCKKLPGISPNDRRAKEVIDISWLSSTGIKKPTAADISDGPAFVNFSQNPSRKPWGNTFPTFTTSTKVFSYRLGRRIVPRETLMLHGFDRDCDLSENTPSEIRNLVGETMSLPCVGACLLAIALVGRIPKLWEGRADQGSDVE